MFCNTVNVTISENHKTRKNETRACQSFILAFSFKTDIKNMRNGRSDV